MKNYTKKRVNVGLIGCGYWGSNLMRNFHDLGSLRMVSDKNNLVEKKVKSFSRNIEFTNNYKKILQNKEIDAIVIATPAQTHYKLVKEALVFKKHVFVEKPLCLNLNNGKEYWVSNEMSGTVSIIDTLKQEIKHTINFSIDGIRKEQITPVDFAYSKKKKLVFVTLGRANHVAAVDAQTYEVKKYILAGKRVWGADVTADEKELIVTNGNSDDISIIDIERFVTVKDIPTGKTPHTVKIKK